MYDYYTFLRKVGAAPFDGDDERSKFSFGEGTNYGTYATLGSPIASNLTWEKTHQYDLGFDLGFFNNRLGATIDLYIRAYEKLLPQSSKESFQLRAIS